MTINDLSNLSLPEKAVLHQALLSHIKSGSNYGYTNGDRMHPAYSPPFSPLASNEDGPDKNTIYRAMKALSWEAGEFDEVTPDEVVASWQVFCELSQKYRKTK